jgi:hypothetical protein
VNDDPFNRPGMKKWDEDTPAFKIIRILAELRRNSAAVQRGTYHTILANDDVLVYERTCIEVESCKEIGGEKDRVLVVPTKQMTPFALLRSAAFDARFCENNEQMSGC